MKFEELKPYAEECVEYCPYCGIEGFGNVDYDKETGLNSCFECGMEFLIIPKRED